MEVWGDDAVGLDQVVGGVVVAVALQCEQFSRQGFGGGGEAIGVDAVVAGGGLFERAGAAEEIETDHVRFAMGTGGAEPDAAEDAGHERDVVVH